MGERFFSDVMADLRAAADGTDAEALLKAFMYGRGFRSLLLHRMARACLRLGIPVAGYVLARHFWGRNCDKYKNDISVHAQLEGGIRLPHPVGVVIGDGVVVRCGAIIMQGVTLGAKDVRSKRNIYRLEVLGDAVIGASATVVGNVVIGYGATVAANSLVTRAVPAGRTAMGVPAKVIEPVAAASFLPGLLGDMAQDLRVH